MIGPSDFCIVPKDDGRIKHYTFTNNYITMDTDYHDTAVNFFFVFNKGGDAVR